MVDGVNSLYVHLWPAILCEKAVGLVFDIGKLGPAITHEVRQRIEGGDHFLIAGEKRFLIGLYTAPFLQNGSNFAGTGQKESAPFTDEDGLARVLPSRDE
jgi:hypothetical protein